MGSKYNQISMEERCYISQLRKEGKTIRKIATTLDRSPSSISRELLNNCSPSHSYTPTYANLAAKSKRWKGSKLERNLELQTLVLSLLKQGLSPEQISGRLAQINDKHIISYETIYRFIYSQIKKYKDYSWRHYLPYSKSKRGHRKLKASNPTSFIKNRVSIHQRPLVVSDRTQPGHWEADLMLFSKYGQALLVMQDRLSRFIVLNKQPNKSAQPIANQMLNLFKKLPASVRQTITFDNGTEFAKHYLLNKIGVHTYFCDTHSPWQKGSVENAIGRMRRVLPRKTDLAILSKNTLQARVMAYNHTPRKCLGYLTPAEVFINQVLHFKCESTFPPSRG